MHFSRTNLSSKQIERLDNNSVIVLVDSLGTTRLLYRMKYKHIIGTMYERLCIQLSSFIKIKVNIELSQEYTI